MLCQPVTGLYKDRGLKDARNGVLNLIPMKDPETEMTPDLVQGSYFANSLSRIKPNGGGLTI